MSNTATLKDNHLYLTYDVYDYGHKVRQKIIPVEDIECIKAKIGKGGGMHTWVLKGYNPEYSNESYNKDNPRDVQIFAGDRKDTDLIYQILEVLPNCKYIEEVEEGGAPW